MYKRGYIQIFLQRLSEMDFIHFVLNSVRSWFDFRSALHFKRNCIIQALSSAFLIYFHEMTGLAEADLPLKCLDYSVAMETGVKVP